jgi:retron-type reverse transcriptase
MIMKRIGNLYEKIISIENLQHADNVARRGKLLSHGVRVHDRRREENILELHEMLKNKTFRTSQYFVFKIYEPKEREIYRLPYWPDRIVHHAVMSVLEPIWVSLFTSDTYSCIKGRGINAAMLNVKKALKDVAGTQYCLKIDIRKFYPSVDHDILKSIIRRKIKCSDTLELLDGIIDSASGVPIGNYLSQYFANLYLTYFDHFIKEELNVKYYFRYADDMVFLHHDKEYLHILLSKIKQYLNDNLKLALKGNYQIFPVEARGIDFVGFVFYHTHTRMRKGIKKNFCKTVAKLNKRTNLTDKQYKMRIAPWLGWAKHSNSKNLLKTILKSDVYGKL